MSQIEQNFRQILSRNPEIEKCYAKGLINRRSLARYLIKQGIARTEQIDAVIAMIRRYEFREQEDYNNKIFSEIKINIKDNILIFDFEKNKELIKHFDALISKSQYDRGDTLKIVVGSSIVKLFIDKENRHIVDNIINGFKVIKERQEISEISLLFPEKITNSKGILSYITQELLVNDISISEFLTATPELLVYVEEKYVMKTYEVLKNIKNSA